MNIFLIIQFESLQDTMRKPVRAKLLKSATLREKKDVRRDLKIEGAGKRKFADKKRTRRAEGKSKGEETHQREGRSAKERENAQKGKASKRTTFTGGTHKRT